MTALPVESTLRPLPSDVRAARPPKLRLPHGWPLVALVGLYPAWWAIGMGQFIWPLMAVPMAWSLVGCARTRVPPHFGIWLLLLTWMVGGAVALGVQVDGTVTASAAHHLPAYAFHLAQYLSATVTMLYVGNLTEAQFSRARLVRLLGIFFLYVLAGGVLGLVWPGLNFTTPVESLLNAVFGHGTWNASFITDLAHPHAADVQDVLGYTSSRPAAPFPYTNTWGVVISSLVTWFVVWLWPTRLFRARGVVVGALLVFTVAVVASLDRGVWIGVIAIGCYLGLRLLTPRRAAALVTVLAISAVVVFASPLSETIRLRLEHPHSNAGRLEQALAAVHGAQGSPVIGYGSTRTLLGNTNSISEGPTPDCPDCGGIAIGSAGELWLILFANGFVGAVLFLSFLVLSIWTYRRDRSPAGVAGRITVMLALLYALFYDLAGPPLTLCLIAVALLWRDQRAPRAED